MNEDYLPGGASRLAALLLPQILKVFSVVAPGQPGAALRTLVLASPQNPVLIRIETKSGHGLSNLTKQLETIADVYAFMLHNLGVS